MQSLFGYFSLLAIFISCLGLLGLASYAAEQRTKEVGIRKVLGASTSGLTLLLSNEFTRWILIANGIAWPAAYLAAQQWLKTFAYRIDIGHHWTVFPLAAAMALCIAWITVGFQAIRAAARNPVDSLKYE